MLLIWFIIFFERSVLLVSWIRYYLVIIEGNDNFKIYYLKNILGLLICYEERSRLKGKILYFCLWNV